MVYTGHCRKFYRDFFFFLMLTVLPKWRWWSWFYSFKKWDSGRVSKFAWGHAITKQNWNCVSFPCPYSHNHQAAHFPHPWSQPWGLGLALRKVLGLVSCPGAWALHQSLVPVPSHWSPCTAAFQASWELCPCHRLSSGGQHSFSENRGHASRWVSLLLSAPISALRTPYPSDDSTLPSAHLWVALQAYNPGERIWVQSNLGPSISLGLDAYKSKARLLLEKALYEMTFWSSFKEMLISTLRELDRDDLMTGQPHLQV